MRHSGAALAFLSDSDFSNEGIADEQREIWLWERYQTDIYVPLVLRQYQ